MPQDAAPLFETCYEYDVLGRLLAHTDPKGKIAHFLNDPAVDRL